MILFGMGIMSELVMVYVCKIIFGYCVIVLLFIVIVVISFLVWGYYMFVSG